MAEIFQKKCFNSLMLQAKQIKNTKQEIFSTRNLKNFLRFLVEFLFYFLCFYFLLVKIDFSNCLLISSNGNAPGFFTPSAKNIDGVPRTPFFIPNSRFLSIAVTSHFSVFPLGLIPFTIQSFHALALSLLHQICLDFSKESGDKIGYKKT